MPRAKVNGIELAYEDMGAGEPLILIMGLGAQMVLWPDALCAQLVEAGFRVIRFDNRDIGQSTWLDDAPVPDLKRILLRSVVPFALQTPYQLTDMAADTVELLNYLGIEQAHIVGSSMGGMIAQMIAIDHPTRVATLTTLMSSHNASPRYLRRPSVVRAVLSPMPEEREDAVLHLSTIFKLLAGSHWDFDWDEARKSAACCIDRGFNQAGFLRQLAAMHASGDRSQQLSKINAPALVIHGTKDPLLRLAAGRALAKRIPGARFRAFEGMGHSIPKQLLPRLAAEIESIAALSATNRSARQRREYPSQSAQP